MNRLLEEIDEETTRTGAVFLIERAASFYQGMGIALREILGPVVLAREAREIERDLRELAGRAQALEILAAEALGKVKP
jgi:hypothetical protein